MVLEKGKKSDHMKPTNLSHEERVSTLTNVVIFCGLHGESGMILSLTNFSGRLKKVHHTVWIVSVDNDRL